MNRFNAFISGVLLSAAVILSLGFAPAQLYTDGHAYQLTGPGTGRVAVVISDTVELAEVARSIIAESAGDVTYVTIEGTTETTTMVAGQTLPMQVKQIKATGTTLTVGQITLPK